MKTNKVVETNTETSKFGYYDLEKEEFYPIETDDDIKKYAKKLKNEMFLMGFLMRLHDDLKECIIADLTEIWQRLDRMDG